MTLFETPDQPLPTCAVFGCAHPPEVGSRWCTHHARLGPTPLPDPRRQQPGKVGAHHAAPARRAAVLSMPRAGTHRAQLLDHLLAQGPRTCAALADATGKSRNQTGARMLELREQGWVEYLRTDDGAIVVEPTDNEGNTGQVQQLTAEGRAQWKAP